MKTCGCGRRYAFASFVLPRFLDAGLGALSRSSWGRGGGSKRISRIGGG